VSIGRDSIGETSSSVQSEDTRSQLDNIQQQVNKLASEWDELREENQTLIIENKKEKKRNRKLLDEMSLRLDKAVSDLMARKSLPIGNQISNAGQNGYEFNGYNQQQQQLPPPPPPYQNPSQGYPPHQNGYQQQHYPQNQPQLHYQHQNHDIQRSYGYVNAFGQYSNGAAGMGVPSMQYGGVHHSQQPQSTATVNSQWLNTMDAPVATIRFNSGIIWRHSTIWKQWNLDESLLITKHLLVTIHLSFTPEKKESLKSSKIKVENEVFPIFNSLKSPLITSSPSLYFSYF
jgi:hypothetical protein